MKDTIKRLAVFVIAFAVAYVTLAEEYSAATGFVTLNGKDSGGVSSFISAGKWSDGREPHSGTNYYIGADCLLNTPTDGKSYEFKGDRLVVDDGGKFNHAVNMNGSIWFSGSLEMLPGAYYSFGSVGKILSGIIDIRGTESSPVVFYISRATGTFTVTQGAEFRSEATGVMEVQQRGEAPQTFSYTGDWTKFYGTLIMPTNLTIQVKDGFDTPGTFRTLATGETTLKQQANTHTMTFGKIDVPSGGNLAVSSSAGLTVGDLSVGSGANLGFASTGSEFLVHVTNRLELADGATVGVPKAFDCKQQGAQTSLVFRLSPQAVSSGLPDWDKVSFPYDASNYTSAKYAGDLPHAYPFVMDDAEVSGGKYMGLVSKPVVCMTNQNLISKSACDPALNPAMFWSNGRFPEKGFDYLVLHQILFQNCGEPYVFPGDSMTLRSTDLLLHKTAKDVTVANLTLAGGCRVRPMDPNNAYVLRGKLSLSTKTSTINPGVTAIQNANGVTISIASEIMGDNDLNARLLVNDGNIRYLYGTLALTGMNTNWTGKLSVSTTNDTYMVMVNNVTPTLFDVSAASNLTLRVSDARNLGGPMAAFTYDALAISNNCRLAVDASTTFDEPTRGWYFPRNVFLSVAEGATATCKNTITLGGGIVKEGAGTLCLASKPVLENGGATVSVEAGTLAVGKSDALKNIDVSFAAGTTFAVDVASNDADMRTKGVDLTTSTVTKADAELKLSLLGLPETPGKRGCGPYAVCTYSSSRPIAFKPMKGPWSGVSMRPFQEETDNGDGTRTLKVAFKPVGVLITYR